MKKIRYSKKFLEIDVTHSELTEEYTVKEYREYGEKTFVEDGNALVTPTSKSLEQVEDLGEKMALLTEKARELTVQVKEIEEEDA